MPAHVIEIAEPPGVDHVWGSKFPSNQRRLGPSLCLCISDLIISAPEVFAPQLASFVDFGNDGLVS